MVRASGRRALGVESRADGIVDGGGASGGNCSSGTDLRETALAPPLLQREPLSAVYWRAAASAYAVTSHAMFTTQASLATPLTAAGVRRDRLPPDLTARLVAG
jgi:hypothetical protein